MLREKLSEWIEKEREKGNIRLTVSTVGVLYDFCYWLERDAEQRDGADLAQHICPSCAGDKYIFNNDGMPVGDCPDCKGTGQI